MRRNAGKHVRPQLFVILLCILLSHTSVALAQLPSSYITITSSASYPLETTNSDKVASDVNNGLHLVFQDGYQLKHSYSTTSGRSWSSPANVTTLQSTSPALSRDDNGHIGVVFVAPTTPTLVGNLYYSYWTGSSWSQPLQVSNGGIARSPSMAGYGDRMHIVWSDGFRIRYASLQTTNPVALPTAETVFEGTICNPGDLQLPSIAVANSASGGSQPVVRVAFYFAFPQSTNCGSPGMAGVYLLERPLTVGLSTWQALEPNFSLGGAIFRDSQPASTPQVKSLSLSANRNSGYFFMTYCFRPNSTELWQTWLARGTRVIGSTNWQKTALFGGPTADPVIADIVSYQQTADWFKIAYSSEYLRVTPPRYYGQTFIRSGQWPTGTAAPSYPPIGAQLKSSYGRTPQAINFETEDPVTTEIRGINLVYSYRSPGMPYDEIRTDPYSYY